MSSISTVMIAKKKRKKSNRYVITRHRKSSSAEYRIRNVSASNHSFIFSTNRPRSLLTCVVCDLALCDTNRLELCPVSFMPAPGLTCSTSHRETPLATGRSLLASSSLSACNLRYSSPLTRKNSSSSIAFLKLALYTAMTTSPTTGTSPPKADTALLNNILPTSQGGRSASRALRTTRT